jgi:carbon monoxide dehydrogenase subunit G
VSDACAPARSYSALVAVSVNGARIVKSGSSKPFSAAARNRWTVTPVDERRARVSYNADFTTRGLLGRLAGRLLLMQAARAGRHLLVDLAHDVQHGVPSPREPALD